MLRGKACAHVKVVNSWSALVLALRGNIRRVQGRLSFRGRGTSHGRSSRYNASMKNRVRGKNGSGSPWPTRTATERAGSPYIVDLGRGATETKRYVHHARLERLEGGRAPGASHYP